MMIPRGRNATKTLKHLTSHTHSLFVVFFPPITSQSALIKNQCYFNPLLLDTPKNNFQAVASAKGGGIGEGRQKKIPLFACQLVLTRSEDNFFFACQNSIHDCPPPQITLPQLLPPPPPLPALRILVPPLFSEGMKSLFQHSNWQSVFFTFYDDTLKRYTEVSAQWDTL